MSPAAALLLLAVLQDADWESRTPPDLTRRFPDLPQRLAKLTGKDVPALLHDLKFPYDRCTCPWILQRLMEFESPKIGEIAYRSGGAVIRPILRSYLRYLEDMDAVHDGFLYAHAYTTVRNVVRPLDLPLIQDELLESDNLRIRVYGIRLLGHIGTRKACAELAALTKDADSTIRQEAFAALQEAGSDRVPATAESLLKDESVPIRFAAARALHQAGQADGLEAVAAIAKLSTLEAFDAVLYLAQHAPNRIPEDVAGRALDSARERLKDDDEETRTGAALYLILRGAAADRSKAMAAVTGHRRGGYSKALARALLRPENLADLLRAVGSNRMEAIGIWEADLSGQEIVVLIEKLAELSGDPRLRTAAGSWLHALADHRGANLPVEKIARLARRVLSDPYGKGYEVWCGIAQSLGDRESLLLIARNLDRRPSFAAMNAVASAKVEEALPTIRKLAADPDFGMSKDAIRALIRYGVPDAGALGLDFLEKHGDRDSLDGLAKVAQPHHRERILKMLSKAEKPWCVKSLLEMLNPIATAEDLTLVRGHLDSQEDEIRQAAVALAVRLKDRSLVPGLRKAAESMEYGADDAFQALRDILGKEGAEDYVTLLVTGDILVRRRAAAAIAEFGIEKSISTLERMVRTDISTGGEALEALGALQGRAVLPLVREVRDWGSYDSECAAMLARFGEPADVRWVIERVLEWERPRMAVIWLRALDALVHRSIYEKGQGAVEVPESSPLQALAAKLTELTGLRWSLSPALSKKGGKTGWAIRGPTLLRALFGESWSHGWDDIVPICEGPSAMLATSSEAYVWWAAWWTKHSSEYK